MVSASAASVSDMFGDLPQPPAPALIPPPDGSAYTDETVTAV
jgi:hypothetical protein